MGQWQLVVQWKDWYFDVEVDEEIGEDQQLCLQWQVVFVFGYVGYGEIVVGCCIIEKEQCDQYEY